MRAILPHRALEDGRWRSAVSVVVITALRSRRSMMPTFVVAIVSPTKLRTNDGRTHHGLGVDVCLKSINITSEQSRGEEYASWKQITDEGRSQSRAPGRSFILQSIYFPGRHLVGNPWLPPSKITEDYLQFWVIGIATGLATCRVQ